MTKRKTNPTKRFKALVQTDIGDWTVLVVYASVDKRNGMPVYQKLSLSGDLAGRFRHIAERTLRGLRDRAEKNDVELFEYSESSNPHGHQVEYLDLGRNDFLKDQIANLDDVGEVSTFRAEKTFMKGLRFYGIILQPPQGGTDGAMPILLFRKYSTAYLLGRKRFAIHWSEQFFDLVSERAYLFDDRIDCIVFGDLAFVLRKSDFKKIFQFYALLEKEADKALGDIRRTVTIQGADEFEEVCKRHPYRLALLRDISQQSYLSSLTPEILKKTIEETKAPVETAGDDKNTELVFDRSKPWAILRLLNDAYYRSVMTGRYLEADSLHERNV